MDRAIEPDVHAAAAGPLPLHATLDALEAWQQQPGPETTEALRGALGDLIGAHGISGAFVEIDAPQLPRLGLGVGEMAGRSEPPAAPVAVEHSLEAGGRMVGRVWLPSSDGNARELVRALGLAVDATSSRAGVRVGAARLAALDAAVRAISGVRSVERVLQLIVDQVRLLVGARYAALGIVDDAGLIERFITSGITREQRGRIGDLPRGHGLLGLIIREDRSFRIDDIAHHMDSYGFPPHHPQMHSFLGVPVTVKGRSVGNLYLTNKRGDVSFTEEDQRLVETFSLHAGIAIENARLNETVSRLAVLDERERIGKDLHDGIIQSLYAVGLSLEDVPELLHDEPEEAMRRVDRAVDSINLTIRDIRNFIFGLRPAMAEHDGLAGGLSALADETRLNTVLDVDVELPDRSPSLRNDRVAELLSITKEALSNVARHARASGVKVGLQADANAVRVTVTDNGVGFDPSIDGGDEHHGLRNMRGRADALGGTLEIDSSRNEGTRVSVRIPIEEVEDDDR